MGSFEQSSWCKMLINTNKLFCYWLQGYYEISGSNFIDRKITLLIEEHLNMINEELGEFTKWLYEVCLYLKSVNYNSNTCEHFGPIIANALNSIFLHVIDNSYDTTKSPVELQKIHNGIQ